MIRGIAGTVKRIDLIAGAFYLFPRYDRTPDLVQVVRTRAATEEANEAIAALIFEPGGNPELLLADVDQNSPYVLMPDVSIRIDPPSLGGNSLTTGLRAGMFFVSGETPYVVATIWNRGYNIVNLSNGEIEDRNFHNEPWIIFNRWQLVVDENGEEVPIANFGAEPESD